MRFTTCPVVAVPLVLAAAASVQASLPISPPAAGTNVEYRQQIAPLLAANCTACHNAQRAEGGLRLDSLEAIKVGGDSGAAAIAGQPATSPLFLRASHQQEDVMPPADNAVGARSLNPEELGLLQHWIASGLPAAEPQEAAAVAWLPLPAGMGGIVATAVSPDGRTTAAARSGRVDLFDTGTGVRLASLVNPNFTPATGNPPVAHRDPITAIAFGPKSDLLATGSFRTIRLWQRMPPLRVGELVDTTGATAMAAGADGGLAVGRSDGNLLLFERPSAGDCQPVARLTGHTEAIVLVGWLDQHQLVSVDQAGLVLVHRPADQQPPVRLQVPDVRAAALLPNSRTLVTSCGDRAELQLWSVSDLPSVAEASGPTRRIGLSGTVASILIAPKEPAGAIVTAGPDGTARLIEVGSGRELRQFSHGGKLQAVSVDHTGKRLATAGEGGLKLWNLSDGKLLASVAGDPRLADEVDRLEAEAAILKQTGQLAAGRMKEAAKAKEAVVTEQETTAAAVPKAEQEFATKAVAAKAAGTAVTEAEAALAVAKKQTEAAEAPDQKSAAKIKQDAAQATATNAEMARLAAVEAAEKAERNLESTRRAAVFAVEQLRRVEQRLANRGSEVAATEKAAAAVSSQLEKLRKQEQTSRQPIVQACFLAESGWLLSIDQGGLAVLRAAVDGQPRNVWQPQAVADRNPAGQHLYPLPDGQVAFGGSDSAVSVWQPLSRWSLLRSIGDESTPRLTAADPSGPPVDRVLALAFTTAGDRLVSGSGLPSRTGEIKVWNVSSGSLATAFEHPHSDTVVAVAFSRDGTQLASGSTDRTAKLHSWPEGKLLRSFEGHAGHVLGVAWQPDGQRLATAGGDGVVKVWKTTTGEQERTVSGFSKEVTAVSFPGVTAELLATSGSGVIRLVNPADGKTIREFNGLTGFVQTLAAARDVFVAGTAAGQLGLWRLTDVKIRHAVEPAAAARHD